MSDAGHIIVPGGGNDGKPWEDPWGEPSAGQLMLMKEVATYLEREYPGHPWMVGRVGDSCIVRNAHAWGMRGHGFVLKFDQMIAEEDRKRRLRDLGELLERAGLPRGKTRSWADERLVQSEKRMDQG